MTGSHDYSWHDGRLHALATVALAPGRTPAAGASRCSSTDAGPRLRWRVAWAPLDRLVWPIVVLLACVMAAARVRRPALDARVAQQLGALALIALAVGSAGNELHGHPNVTVLPVIELGIILAFVAWGLRLVLFENPGTSRVLRHRARRAMAGADLDCHAARRVRPHRIARLRRTKRHGSLPGLRGRAPSARDPSR